MAAPRPEVGDILLVIHDFIARSSDELSLAKGDRVELIERDDEFGDGWFLGKHLVNGNSGLFPEVYTRPAPKTSPTNNFSKPLATLPEGANEPKHPSVASPIDNQADTPTPPPAPVSPAESIAPVTLPLNSIKQDVPPSESAPAVAHPPSASLGRLNTNQDHVLNETLNVIEEHITDLRSKPSNGGMRAPPTDSGSEYSATIDHRLSYIHGEETDEEEEGMHSRSEVEAWSADEVAEYLFTVGVEKSHCEVFRDQEISGEVLLGMDQSSLFIKAFELGSVGRRLKTWQKIKSLQDECNNIGVATRRTTQTYGSEIGSEDAKRSRSRADTLTNSMPRMTPVDDRSMSLSSKRLSFSQTPKLDTSLVSPVSPIADSPTRPSHMKRPSAASVRDLHHSRRHSSSTDFRLTGTTMGNAVTPKLATSGTFPQAADGVHKKQPSFDRNWTLGSASQRPLSSTGFQDVMQQSGLHAPDSNLDTDRGYFSGTDVDGRRRNVLKKRDSTASHGRKHSYADEQRVRSATAISRHSRFGSIDSTRDSVASPAAQKYYGLQSNSHRRTASTSTTQSARPAPPVKDTGAPSVTKLDGATSKTRESPAPMSPAARQGIHAEWLSAVVKPSVKVTGLRAISDSVSGDRNKIHHLPTVVQSKQNTHLRRPADRPSILEDHVFRFSRDHPPLAMSVEETLDKLDPPASSAEETPCHLWNALEADFKQNANLKETDFSRWALSNVDRKILKIAADSKLADEIRSLRLGFPSRYVNVLTALDVSLGILVQLFGFKVVSSRACNSSFIKLCKAHPNLRIEKLYDAWTTQPTVVNSRLISEITRFQRAANSFDDNIASHVQRSRRKTKAKETTSAVAASTETADRETSSRDTSPHTPTRDRRPPAPDLRRSFSDPPEASRRFCRVRERDIIPLDIAPSPPFKRARPLQSDLLVPLDTPRPSVQRRALDFTFSPFEPESTNDRDTSPEVSSLPSYMAQSQGQEHDSDTSDDEFVDSAVYFDMDDETEQPVAETVKTNHGAAGCRESQSSEKGTSLVKLVLDDIAHTDRIEKIRLRIAQDETYAAEATQKKNDSEECIAELRRKTLARLQAIEDQDEGSLDEEEDWCSLSKAKADAVGYQEEIEKEMASSVRRKRVADRALGAEMKKRPRVAEAAQKLCDALRELEHAVEEPLPPCQ